MTIQNNHFNFKKNFPLYNVNGGDSMIINEIECDLYEAIANEKIQDK